MGKVLRDTIIMFGIGLVGFAGVSYVGYTRYESQDQYVETLRSNCVDSLASSCEEYCRIPKEENILECMQNEYERYREELGERGEDLVLMKMFREKIYGQ